MVKEYLGNVLPGENSFTQGNRKWELSTLTAACEGLETMDLDLMSLDIDVHPWRFEDWSLITFLHHINRMENVDMDIPIILTPYGYICDGWHRVCRAIMEGRKTIKAYRLKVMPEPDKID